MKLPTPLFAFVILAVLSCGNPLFAAQKGKVPAGDPPKWGVLKEKMRRDGDGLRITRRANGHQSIDLDGRFTHMSALVRDADGKLRRQCFTSFEGLDRALRGNSPVKIEEVRHHEVAEK